MLSNLAILVENVGDKEGKAVFVEPYPTCKPCGAIDGYVSPFTVSPECYKVLAEDDDWYTGLLTMEVGAEDAFHHHKDHLICALLALDRSSPHRSPPPRWLSVSLSLLPAACHQPLPSAHCSTGASADVLEGDGVTIYPGGDKEAASASLAH